MSGAGRILLVDDDPQQVDLLRAILESDGWDVIGVTSGEQAVAEIDGGAEVDVVVTDLLMPGMDGKAVLAAVLERRPELPVIILTAYATVDSAVELLHAGAYHYLSKPPKVDELRIAVRRAHEVTAIRRELERLRRRVGRPSGGPPGRSKSLTLAEVERRHLLAVLHAVGGNKLRAAEILGIDRSTLHRKIKQIKGLPGLDG